MAFPDGLKNALTLTIYTSSFKLPLRRLAALMARLIELPASHSQRRVRYLISMCYGYNHNITLPIIHM